MNGFPPIVDALGGVELEALVSVPDMGIRKGSQVQLNGKSALAYVRERHNDAQGDLGRTKRQQQFIAACMSKIKHMGAMEAVPKLYNQVARHVNTNLSLDQMGAMAVVLNNIDISAMQSCSLAGQAGRVGGADGPSVYQYDEAALRELLRDVYFIKK